MSDYKFWTKVGVAMASAAAGLSAATPITSIAAASPAALVYSGTDPVGLANGVWVLLTTQGMVEVNRRLFRVAGLDTGTNTFNLEGLDATGFNAFVSGSFQIVTYDKTFSTLSEPSSSGGEPVFEDTTLIHSAKDTQAIVSSTPEGYSFVSIWAPNDPALIEANRAYISKTARPVLITYADNSKYAFVGTVSAPLAPGASGRKVSTTIAFQMENTGTFYAS